MRCARCGTAMDERVFPGATVSCRRCGATEEIDPSGQVRSSSPYREMEPSPAPSPPSGWHGDVGAPCPRCSRGLEEANGADLACATCQGVFVEHADLAARIDGERPFQAPTVRPRHARSRPAEPTVRYGRCPRCGTVMTRTNFGGQSGIVVDVCREHGTWFDRGELDSALEFVRAGGLEGDG